MPPRRRLRGNDGAAGADANDGPPAPEAELAVEAGADGVDPDPAPGIANLLAGPNGLALLAALQAMVPGAAAANGGANNAPAAANGAPDDDHDNDLFPDANEEHVDDPAAAGAHGGARARHARPRRLPHFLERWAANPTPRFPIVQLPDHEWGFTTHPLDSAHPPDLPYQLHQFGLTNGGLSDGSSKLGCPWPAYLDREAQVFDVNDHATAEMQRMAAGRNGGQGSVLWDRDLFNYRRWYNVVAMLQLVIQEQTFCISKLSSNLGADAAMAEAATYETMLALDKLRDFTGFIWDEALQQVNIINFRATKSVAEAKDMQERLYGANLKQRGFSKKFQALYDEKERLETNEVAKARAKQRANARVKPDKDAAATGKSPGGSGK